MTDRLTDAEWWDNRSAFWRQHVTDHVVTTEQALSFIDEIDRLRAEVRKHRAAVDDIDRWDNHTHHDAEGQGVCPTCRVRTLLDTLTEEADRD